MNEFARYNNGFNPLFDDERPSSWRPERKRAAYFLFLLAGSMLMVIFMDKFAVSQIIASQAEIPNLRGFSHANRSSELDSLPESMRSDIDFDIDPCDNFYEFSCGRWINATKIPADKGDVSISFDAVSKGVEEEMRGLFEIEYPEKSEFRKVNQWYKSCMNTNQIDEFGATPLEPYLAIIDSVSDKQDLVRTLVYLMIRKIHPFIGLGVDRSISNTTMHILKFKNPDLFFPNQEYVGWPVPTEEFWTTAGFDHMDFASLQNDTNLRSRRAAANYYKKINELAGYSESEAESAAMRSIWIETELATFVQEDEARPNQLENPAGLEQIDLETLETRFGSLPWRNFFESFSAECAKRNLSCANSVLANVANLVVQAPIFYQRLSASLGRHPPTRWVPFLRTSAIHTLMPYLSSSFYNASLSLVAEVQGVEELPARGKFCVAATSGALPMLSERLYTQKYFSPEDRAKGLEMLQFIKAEFIDSMAALSWMDPVTKERALAKARAMEMNLGGPDRRFELDYPVDAAGCFANAQHASQMQMLRGMHKLDEPVRRSHWRLTAMTANAMYSVTQNAVFIPAAIMQPPFFSGEFEMERNFGGLGAVIGHEMTHGFDSTGRRYDEAGAFHAWWDPPSEREFLRRAGCLERLFGGFAIAGVRLSGHRLLRENLADSGGAAIAARAFRSWYRAQTGGAAPPPERERELFTAFGQLWCDRGRREQERLLAQEEAHAPGVFRCNGVVSQSAAFAAAFGCPAGSPMNPPDKCTVW